MIEICTIHTSYQDYFMAYTLGQIQHIQQVLNVKPVYQ